MALSQIWSPVSDTVKKLRERYRDTRPSVCTARLRIVTDYYKQHLGEPGIILRSGSFKNMCEKMPVMVREDEIICGNVTVPYRGSALFPETSGLGPVVDEIKSGEFYKRTLEPYDITDENAAYMIEVNDFWKYVCNSNRVTACAMDGLDAILGNGVLSFGGKRGGQHGGPVGHFCSNYDKMLTKGFAAVRAEAKAITDSLEGKLYGDSAQKYHFYRAIVTVCDGALIYAQRVADAVRAEAEKEADPARKQELLEMERNYRHMFINPVDSFFEAAQALFLYHTLMIFDGNLHGMSWGRIDQYLGKFYEADLAAGKITPERAQEIIDQLFLRIGEMNRVSPAFTTRSTGGYTSGQLATLGGVKKAGDDAANPVSFMMLQASARLKLHDPTMALRVGKTTPEDLIKMAVRCSMEVGGIPTFENDDVIIPIFHKMGHDSESANNYCLIGCVEPGGCGDDWPAPGGAGGQSYFNLANVLIHTLNNGVNPIMVPLNAPGKVTGLQLGHLYDYKSFEELKDAYAKELDFFVSWYVSQMNMFEWAAGETIPTPIVSAMMDGCMEKGLDVMQGGAKYNSTGIPGVGLGTVAQSLNVIRELVFEKNLCTAKELYDAIMADWEGYDELRKLAKDVPCFGNGEEKYDENAVWLARTWSDIVNSKTGPRGRYKAGLWSIARHVADGPLTNATPDGRRNGEVLSDGIGPVQGTDTSGPTALLRSIAAIDHGSCPNGTLLNMRFSPSALKTDEDITKLVFMIRSFFAMGGMHLQFNFVKTETMKKAKVQPKEYKDLVVRVAGFSAYFTELHPGLQDEIIRRTELQSV